VLWHSCFGIKNGINLVKVLLYKQSKIWYFAQPKPSLNVRWLYKKLLVKQNKKWCHYSSCIMVKSVVQIKTSKYWPELLLLTTSFLLSNAICTFLSTPDCKHRMKDCQAMKPIIQHWARRSCKIQKRGQLIILCAVYANTCDCTKCQLQKQWSVINLHRFLHNWRAAGCLTRCNTKANPTP